MKSKERVLTALDHGIPDRVPIYDMGIDSPIVLKLMNAKTYSWELAIECHKKIGFDMITAWPETFPREWFTNDRGRRGYIDEWGRRRVITEDGTKWYAGGVIKSEEIFDSWNWPDPYIPERYIDVDKTLKNAKELAVIGFVGGPFERAALGREHQFILMDFYKNPEFAGRHMRKVMEYWIEVGKIEIDMGVDAIIIADDYSYKSGPFFSPKIFQKYVLPLLKKEVNVFKKRGVRVIHHSDGYITPLIPYLIKAGIDGLHSLEPAAGVDIGQVKKSFGDRLVLVGNIDCGSLLSFGKPQEVRRVVRETIVKAAPGGGYILSSSNSIHRGVNIENILAMIEEARRFKY
ncbi:MAG: uroporphyrinogen decarboxylase family protein [Candidatus Jordarchaeum sp.]|uniref:uroporphyrinogen decarboxylase family protein n=1 Tax=Candidatus Jordarchaeum sp. TaxID=2823881 RepID=UPI00404AAB4A